MKRTPARGAVVYFVFTPTLITDWCAPKRIAANVDPMTGQRYFGYGLRGFGVASDRTHSCRRPSSSSRSRRDAPQSDAEDRDHGRERDGPQERVVDLLAVDDLPGRRLLRHLACGERGECRARSARRKLVARTRTEVRKYAVLFVCVFGHVQKVYTNCPIQKYKRRPSTAKPPGFSSDRGKAHHRARTRPF